MGAESGSFFVQELSSPFKFGSFKSEIVESGNSESTAGVGDIFIADCTGIARPCSLIKGCCTGNSSSSCDDEDLRWKTERTAVNVALDVAVDMQRPWTVHRSRPGIIGAAEVREKEIQSGSIEAGFILMVLRDKGQVSLLLIFKGDYDVELNLNDEPAPRCSLIMVVKKGIES